MKYAAIGAFALFTALSVAPAPATAQNPHLGHVAEGWRDTPDNVGLMEAAKMEAAVAAQHAELAARDPENLASVKRHTAHVLHALDPEVQSSGPGNGYGLIKAASGVATHIKLAAEADGASDNIKRHSNHVATSASNVAQWGREIVERGQRIMNTDDGEVAATLIQEIATLAESIMSGHDADGDGRIGWQEGEGGMAQAERHLTLLLEGESSSLE